MNTVLVSWFTMLRIGVTCRALPQFAFTSTRKIDMPSDFFFTSASGVVRASRIIRSECCRREVHTFWPLITYLSPFFTATVLILVVSVPAVGSVTPIDCRRSSPEAILGR